MQDVTLATTVTPTLSPNPVVDTVGTEWTTVLALIGIAASVIVPILLAAFKYVLDQNKDLRKEHREAVAELEKRIKEDASQDSYILNENLIRQFADVWSEIGRISDVTVRIREDVATLKAGNQAGGAAIDSHIPALLALHERSSVQDYDPTAIRCRLLIDQFAATHGGDMVERDLDELRMCCERDIRDPRVSPERKAVLWMLLARVKDVLTTRGVREGLRTGQITLADPTTSEPQGLHLIRPEDDEDEDEEEENFQS